MRVFKAPREDGKVIECVLVEPKGYYCRFAVFEDLNDYGAVYNYDADMNVFVVAELHRVI